MSEVVAAPQRPSYDFLKPLTYVFDDPRWIEKLLYGALFSLAGIILVGAFFVYGYLAQLARNCVAGMERPMPEWTNLGEMFGEGAMFFVIALLYGIPFFVLILMIIPMSILSGVDNSAAQIVGALGSFGVSLILFPAGLALSIWMPAALLNAAVQRRFGAAFEFGAIWSIIKANPVNYILAYLDWMVARFGASFGLLLCCVGVFATSFWSLCVAVQAFAQAYRLREAQ